MTVAALATLFIAKSMAMQQPDVPAILQDRSIFTYLKPGAVEIQPQGTYFAFDALPAAAAAPNAAKLRIIVLIAERQFDSPTRSNIIERRDKERLVALMPLAATYLRNYSKGEVDVTIVLKFVPEPVFAGQIANVARSEFNRNKFDADDSVDRGPYDLATTIESSNVALYVGEPKSGAGILSANIIGAAWNRLTQDGSENIFSPAPGKVPQLTKSLVEHLQGTRSFTEADKNIFSGSATTAPVGLTYPVLLAVEGGALDYIEECLVRQERLPMPFNSGEKTAKSLTFEYKPLTQNPVAIRLKTSTGWEELTLPGGSFDWKTIQVKSSNGEVIQDAQIGVPLLLQGSTRSFPELVHYQFRNFTTSDTAAGLATITERAIRESTPDIAAAIAEETPEQLKTRLNSFNTAEAILALKALLAKAVATPPSVEELAFLNTILTGPYSESVRAEALKWVGKIPNFGSFPQVAPNAVRENWQVRLASLNALAELAKAGVKEKEGCRQLILMSTAQEMALIRRTAYDVLDFNDDDSRKRGEFALINDPSEFVRIFLARKLVGHAKGTFESVKGVLADESIEVRASVARSLATNDLSRKLLQSLVVDSSPKVRAAALQGLANHKGVQAGEIQNTFTDADPVVQYQLVAGAANGAWSLPADVVTKLKSSPFKGISEAALALK